MSEPLPLLSTLDQKNHSADPQNQDFFLKICCFRAKLLNLGVVCNTTKANEFSAIGILWRALNREVTRSDLRVFF